MLLCSLPFSAQTGQWEHYSYGGEIRSLAAYENTVWIGTTAGLVKYDILTQQRQFFNTANSPLLDNWISSVAVSPSGALWVATPDGLFRVQGEDWQHFDVHNSGLVTNSISKILCLSDDELWLLDKNTGVHDYVYHLECGEWTVYSSATCSIGGQVIRDITLDAQGLPWLAYYNTSSGAFGISHFDGSSWISQSSDNLGLPAEDIQCVVNDGARLWISTFYGSLFSIDAQGTQAYDLDDPPYSVYYITALDVDNQGRLLLGYGDWDGQHRLLRRLPDSWEIFDPDSDALGLDFPCALMQDDQGKIWFGTNHGMAVYAGNNWTAFDCSNSPLPSNYLDGMAMDNQDNLWLSIVDESIDYYSLVNKSGDNWVCYNRDDYPLIGEPSNLVCGSDGKVWFANDAYHSNGSIVSFDGTAWNSFSYPVSTAFLNCLRLDPANRSWASFVCDDYQYRIYLLENGVWQEMAVLLGDVRDIVFDGAGNPWMATSSGLIHISDELVIYNTQNSGLPNNDVTCLDFDADRNLWIGTATGLAKFYNGEWQAWDFQLGDYPLRIMQDLVAGPDGRVWCATYNTGLVCFDGSQWTTWTIQNSPVMDDRIPFIALDSQANLWIMTFGDGLTRFNTATTEIGELTQFPGQQSTCLNNFPNPFNPSTTITFSIPEQGPATLSIHNLRGQLVTELCNETALSGGAHSYIWNGKDQHGRDVSSGVYFARLWTPKGSRGIKLLLMK
jgi:ligand-binding sensor domain-containing protein